MEGRGLQLILKREGGEGHKSQGKENEFNRGYGQSFERKTRGIEEHFHQ